MRFQMIPFHNDLLPQAGELLARRHSGDRLSRPELAQRYEDPVEYGIFTHYAQIPATSPDLIQAWFSLSFGIEQDHALADLPDLEPAKPTMPPGIEICKAGSEDRVHLAAMSDVIWKTQVKASVWGVMLPETVRQTAEDWAGLLDEADVTVPE